LAAGVEAFRTGATTVVSADFLVELRGFEPMGIAGAGRSRSLPAARAFSIAIDTWPRLLSSGSARGVAEVASP